MPPAAAAPRPVNRRQSLQFWLGVLFSLLIIGWAIFALDWGHIGQILANIHYGWVLLAVALNFAAFFVRALRWGLMFDPARYRFRALFDTLLLGQAANYISPARVGDLLRAYLFGEMTGASKTQTLATIALEKLWDLVMLLLLTAALSWVFPLPPWLLVSVRGLFLVTLLGISMLALVLWRSDTALDWLAQISEAYFPSLKHRLLTLVQNGLAGFAGLQSSSLVLAILSWSLLVWLVGGVLNYVTFRAMDLSLSLTPAFLLLVVLQIGVALPSLPGRIGVFQGICVLVLGLFGVSYDLAFSYGIILHLIVFVPPIVVAAIISLRLGLKPGQISQLIND